MTVQALMNEWLEFHQKERMKRRTYKRYHDLIHIHILPHWKDRDIQTLQKQEIREFLIQQKTDGGTASQRQLSSATVNMILCVMKLAFSYACDVGYLEKNPCEQLKRAKSDSRSVEAFTVEEQRLLEHSIAESNDQRLHGILLCLYTGLRIGELLGLAWEDVDLERGMLSISKTVYRDTNENGEWELVVDTPKTRASRRIIPLPPYIAQMLREDQKKARSQYLVENKKGERMPIRSYQYLFRKLTERAGVRPLNFHALRHTFATRAIENGLDVRTVADIMGHQSASLTLNLYAHCMLEHKIQVMQKMPRV